MIDLLKSLFVPGSLGLLGVCLLGGLALLGIRGGAWRRSGRVVLVIAPATYLVLAAPPIACQLVDHLASYGPLLERGDASGATAIILLSGDNPEGRLQETIRLYRWLDPRWVVVSGPPGLRDAVVRLGVPPAHVLLESTAATTHQQARRLKPLLAAYGIRRSILVASIIHMPRALRTMRAAGLDVIPSASALDHGEICRPDRRLRWLPHWSALAVSRDALYEYLAGWYYRQRGWLTDPAAPAASAGSPRGCRTQ